MTKRYQIQFPPEREHELSQAEAYFFLIEDGKSVKLRFHDYNDIFARPGLYEQLFYDRLRCTSPQKVTELLQRSVASELISCSELRVIDLGAGNGMMAERLRGTGVSRVVGVDIIPEAREAAFRDRPFVYDDYVVADFTKLSAEQKEDLKDWNFDCLASVAALGFGDIPPRAFFEALKLVATNGWVALNIKETFLDRSDDSGFSKFIRELIFSEYLDIFQLERYTHRFSMEGVPLKYYALIGRIVAPIPDNFIDTCGIE
ncbi:MAG: methyltransferase domain-containing protein [Verrucomicrobia bacterium]|jgi:ubiquinone/menaquinone biosynthesis C-methylase UbiE|nr:methyltransferase domain-containing protein [Verrucomicrobiota bacterium]